MGIGRLDGSKFNLVVSIRHDASATELNEWEQSFQRASELLYDATDGQHQLGDVYVGNDSCGGDSADIWILDQEEGTANAGGLGVLGDASTHITLHGEDRYRPFIVLHELIHHLYGPADEYSGPGTDSAECVGGGSSEACIMEGGWWEGDRFGSDATGGSLVEGEFSELCVATNHDPDDDTYQDDIYDESCWRTMADEYGGLSIPSGTPTTAEPTGTDTINWVELESEERFVLVVDRSGSMAGNKLAEAKYGADWWAEQTLDGEHLGVVSFATGASSPPDYPLQEISGDSDRTDAQGAIGGITHGGRTAIGDGLRSALAEIQGAGDRACTQVVVLLTDGNHNEGEAPGSVLPDLIDGGVRVYTIGIGNSINSSLLQTIASDTGGQFYRIDPSLPQSEQEYQIRERLMEISGEARNGGGLVTTIPERVRGGMGEAEEPTREALPNGGDALTRHNVQIEAGSNLATFGISWKQPETTLRLHLESPSGESFEPGSIPPNARELSRQRPWHGFHVHDPEVGTWALRIYGEAREVPVDLTTYVFSRNYAIGGGLFGRDRVSRAGTVNANLQTYYYNPVVDFDIEGHVRRPGGELEELRFEFDGMEHRCDAGIATASFERTHAPGFYTVSATVEATDAREVAGGEKQDDDDDIESEPVPDFQRTFTHTVQVGEEPTVDIQLQPPTGPLGNSLTVKFIGTNTHFFPGDTRVSFGPGITVQEVEVAEHDTLAARIRIHEQAEVGYRTVVVSTPRFDEHIELEAAFRVTKDGGIDFSPIHPIDMLRFDIAGQLMGIKLEESDEVVDVSPKSADLLTEAKIRGDEVRIRKDEDTGEVEGFDIF